ncbi:MAG: PPOX class F420-dependent oxidoreductase [Microthrixaceae bacterium]|jgi:pyridoxamine 5'-phosphate oxidase family protein
MSFTAAELEYLKSQRLTRLATVDDDGQPDVVPVGYEYDGTHFFIGSMNPVRTRKFRNVEAGNTYIALVVDDLVSTEPWTPRYLRVYGTAEIVERQGQFGSAPYMRITPTVSWSFNLEGQPFSHDREITINRTEHTAPDT